MNEQTFLTWLWPGSYAHTAESAPALARRHPLRDPRDDHVVFETCFFVTTYCPFSPFDTRIIPPICPGPRRDRPMGRIAIVLVVLLMGAHLSRKSKRRGKSVPKR